MWEAVGIITLIVIATVYGAIAEYHRAQAVLEQQNREDKELLNTLR